MANIQALQDCCCFNPRTREGATPSLQEVVVFKSGFNPRTREGATHWLFVSLPRSFCFNPRTREGATPFSHLSLFARHVSIHAPVRVRLA